MACDSERIHQFPTAAGAARYRLKVSGPKGAFTAVADFLDVDTPPAEHWTAAEIMHPKEKRHEVEATRAYVVSVVVHCVATSEQPVKVEAAVGDAEYCRQIA